MTIEQLFFELIRVAIGTADSLSHTPSAKEWQQLCEMAKKQSLMGICFAGVQRLVDSEAEDYYGMTELQFLTWMGMAAKIQQRNEVVNRQCMELQERLAADGLRSCILKGQGVAALYKASPQPSPEEGGSLKSHPLGGDIEGADLSKASPQPSPEEGGSLKSHPLGGDIEGADLSKASPQPSPEEGGGQKSHPLGGDIEGADLSMLRQSGDIDVWVDAPREKIVEWARAHGGKDLTGDLHVDCEIFPDTAVEIHFTPSIASGRKTNRRLQEWFESRKAECFEASPQPSPEEGGSLKSHPLGGDIEGAPVEFNVVYLLHHIYRHYLYEGVGLRQIMDYYMVLKEASLRLSPEGKRDCIQTIKCLGMEKFAGALFWVVGFVFEGNPEYYTSFPLGEDLGEASKRGRRLLEVIMEGGNFGHSTEKYKITGWDKPWSRLSRYVRRNWFLLWDYPEEIVWNMLTKLR